MVTALSALYGLNQYSNGRKKRRRIKKKFRVFGKTDGNASAVRCTVPESVVWWSEFQAADPEVPGSIRGATRFCE
jgi:hypothetical protein